MIFLCISYFCKKSMVEFEVKIYCRKQLAGPSNTIMKTVNFLTKIICRKSSNHRIAELIQRLFRNPKLEYFRNVTHYNRLFNLSKIAKQKILKSVNNI